MPTLRDVSQLRTMRNVKSYRSCPTSTGMSMWGIDLGRRYQEELALYIRELRWLGRRHQEEVARRHREMRRRWVASSWKKPCVVDR